MLELLRGVTGANTVSDIKCYEARLKIDRGYAKWIDGSLDAVNARQSGTQPRPSAKVNFPWTFDHPGRENDVATTHQDSYTEFAHRPRTYFKPPRRYDTTGFMHKTMKGNIVLLASTQDFLKCPAHGDLRSSLHIRPVDVACITFDDFESSDADWSQSDNAESSSEASSEASGNSSDFRSPVSVVRMKMNMRSTSGSSPLFSGVTL